MLQCCASLLTYCSAVVRCPKAFGNRPAWSTHFKRGTKAVPGERCLGRPRQLSDSSLPPVTEAIKTQTPLGADGLIWEMGRELLSVSY